MRCYIRKYTKERAHRKLGITPQEQDAIHFAARAVADEIVYDLAGCYKDGVVPRYDMIQCVCDASRLELKLQEDAKYSGIQFDSLKAKLRSLSVADLYGVVGMTLGPGEVFCV